jgi:hypothetical protein
MQEVNDAYIFVWSSLLYINRQREFSKHWCIERFKIYLKYTLPSILRQTAKNCKPLLICDAFTGHTILDDAKASKALLLSGANMSIDNADLSSFFCGVPADHGSITMMHIDSDDMYAPDAAATFNAALTAADSVGFVRGNLWWVGTDSSGFFVHPRPPFYAHKYTREAGGNIGFNEHARGAVCQRSSLLLSPGKFLVLRHNSNWSQNHYMRKFYLPFREAAEHKNMQELYQLDVNYWRGRQDEVAEFVDT